jgi:TPR repeat protein
MYYYGRGVKMNDQLAFKHFQTAADQGNAKAQIQLGFFYANGYGTAQDTAKAIEWYTKAMDQNSGDASLNLGGMYYYGRCIEVDYQLAFQYFQIASNQGNAPAQLRLAEMYHRGLGVEKNSGMALKLCSSIQKINDDVRCFLGELYHSADTQFQDFSKALDYYNRAEGMDKSYSLRGLGLLYEHGDGVDKDYEKALEFYTQSRDKRNKGGYYNLVLLYYYGKGAAQDYFASFGYFERVLEGVFKEHNTYVLVEEGTELNSHSGQQKKYSYVSERIIFGKAHLYLGIMNEKGQGTSQDHKKALYLFKSSQSLGIDRAKTFLEIQ